MPAARARQPRPDLVEPAALLARRRPVPFREAQRTLEVGGLFMFSTFGPDTLRELAGCFGDGAAHTRRFTDMHDLGDMLVECGFVDPVMDMEVLTLTYHSVDDLVSELRAAGERCAMHDRRQVLRARCLGAMCERPTQAVADGRIPATFEVVWARLEGEPKKNPTVAPSSVRAASEMKAARRLRPRNRWRSSRAQEGRRACMAGNAQRARQKAETRRRLREDTSGE